MGRGRKAEEEDVVEAVVVTGSKLGPAEAD